MILKPEEKLSLIRLYDVEIKKKLEALYNDGARPDLLLHEFLDVNEIEKLTEESKSCNEFSDSLLPRLLASPLSDKLYEALLNFLSTQDGCQNLHKILSMASEADRRSRFNKVLAHLDHFVRLLDLEKSMDYLIKIPIYTQIINVLKSNVMAESRQKMVFLRTIPMVCPMAIYDLMYTIYDASTEGANFANRIFHNDFFRFYQKLDNDRNCNTGRILFCSARESATELMIRLGTPAAEFDPRFTLVNLEWEGFPQCDQQQRDLICSIDEHFFECAPTLRDYQNELCEHALKGTNTIITAPTGSGKTVVAANIIKTHLDTAAAENRRAKVLFLIPNTVIIRQQKAQFEKFLYSRYKVKESIGEIEVPVLQLINSCDVLVATPQKIVNLLKDVQEEDGGSSLVTAPRFYLSTFTLIIFDECHNAIKKTPYAVLMQFYHNMKNTKAMPEEHGGHLPQIVGLTASLGVGKKVNKQEVSQHIATICATLDVHCISAVQRNIDELKHFSPITPDECILVPQGSTEKRERFQRALENMMNKLENVVLEIFRRENLSIADEPQEVTREGSDRPLAVYQQLTKPPTERDHQKYLGWVSCHLNNIVPALHFKNADSSRHVMKTLEILRDCYLALECHQDFNSKESFDDLNVKLEGEKIQMNQQALVIWEENSHVLAGNVTSENAIITKLEKIVLDLKRESPEFRVIIFVRTRQGAKMLASILKGLQTFKESIGVEYILGLNTDNFTKQKQQEVLQGFERGDTRVLIATSVAEEGLDIAKCNMVVKYNYATNEIAHVQRRGRGRAEGSRCILLTNKKALKDQEDSNRMKENAMNEAMRCILRKEIDLETLVTNQQEEMKKAYLLEQEKKTLRLKRHAASNVIYMICCKGCQAQFCQHVDVRQKEQQYYFCHANIWDKLRLESISVEEAEKWKKFGGVGMAKCKKCGRSIGHIVNRNATELPLISATDIVLKVETQSDEFLPPDVKIAKKWKEIEDKYFVPDALRTLDILKMRKAAEQHSVKHNLKL